MPFCRRCARKRRTRDQHLVLGRPVRGISHRTRLQRLEDAFAALTLSLNDEECVNGIRACCIYPGEVATPILRHRPVAPSRAEVDRMLQAEDLGRTIRFVAEMPARVCING